MRKVVQQSDALSATFYVNLKEDLEGGRVIGLNIKEQVMKTSLPAVVVTLKNRLLPPSAVKISDAVQDISASLLGDTTVSTPSP